MKPIEEKVEFKAIDDDFSRPSQPQKEYNKPNVAPPTPQPPKTPNWEKKQDETDMKSDIKSEPKKKISDRLIF